jgi:hypothetical protein
LAQEHFIDITPRPIFAGLKGLNNRMSGRVKMFRGVTIRRRITATHMAAGQAKSEVDPGRTDLQTFLAAIRAGNDVVVNLIQVRAGFGAHDCAFSAI